MSARAIKRMQALAWKPKTIGYRMELGPWFAPEDKPAMEAMDPDAEVTLSNGTTMTIRDYWMTVDNGTCHTISEFPDVFDVTDQAEAIWDALHASHFGEDLIVSDDGFVDAPRLPLVGPTEIMPGWWQVQDERAVCIYPLSDGERFTVHTVIVPHDSAGPLNGRCLSPYGSVLTLNADGRFKTHDRFRAAVTTSLVVFDLCAILVASSIMQADPQVIEKTVRPTTKATRQKRRRDRPGYRSMTTIALPGLRYDKSTGHWTAKTGAGIAWHMVRGHYRLLTSDRYVNKQGQKVWVKPHSKGDPDKGVARKRYVLDSTA